jgi:hypothetical protein
VYSANRVQKGCGLLTVYWDGETITEDEINRRVKLGAERFEDATYEDLKALLKIIDSGEFNHSFLEVAYDWMNGFPLFSVGEGSAAKWIINRGPEHWKWRKIS